MLNWEDIKHNHGFYLRRAEVIGGWLVIAISDVMTPMNQGHSQPVPMEGYEWRTSITFVPDPDHQWKI